eukprot:TRINITY_DN82455_c0_g1_i1.p1 TRINITY_DN82455_c0_g1~~TRINITY_DN82455_c0_g1_i1.p1  ORF type:complete len:550 (+),score=88.05 TRINITY_DN82455_c0_g1_i1:74-1651(+)
MESIVNELDCSEWTSAVESAQQSLQAKAWGIACQQLRRAILLKPAWEKGYLSLSKALVKSGNMIEAFEVIEQGFLQCDVCDDLRDWHEKLKLIRPTAILLVDEAWHTAIAQLKADLQSDAHDVDAAAVINRGRAACGWPSIEHCDALSSQFADKRGGSVGLADLLRQLLRVAGAMPEVFPKGVPLLVQGKRDVLQFSRWQVCNLLCAGILGLVPKQEQRGGLLQEFDFGSILQSQPEKCACLLLYLDVALLSESAWTCEFITIQRNVLSEESPSDDPEFWATCNVQLTSAREADGAIEDEGSALQADFANEFIGGAVFGAGCLQEEIRFCVCPELLASCLVCEAMLRNEALVIVGAQRFAISHGYAGSFRYGGPFVDGTELDARGRRGVHLVAFDALMCTGDNQYQLGLPGSDFGILRELVKTSAAFQGDTLEGEPKRHIATGNWGCVNFGGDPQLKFLLQWMACSTAGRDIVYFPFGDPRMVELKAAIAKWSGHTVGDVWRGIARVFAAKRPNRDSTAWKYVPC